jgi:hypothetical protein
LFPVGQASDTLIIPDGRPRSRGNGASRLVGNPCPCQPRHPGTDDTTRPQVTNLPIRAGLSFGIDPGSLPAFHSCGGRVDLESWLLFGLDHKAASGRASSKGDWNVRRYAAGETPVCFLKCARMFVAVPNPHAAATASTGVLVVSSIS